MKRSLIIGIIAVVVLAVILIVTFYPSGEKPTTCVKAGELSFDESTGETIGECCEGFVEIGDIFYDEDKTCEEIFMIVGYGSICSDCGNANCEEWENRCNCPKDCA